VLELRSLSLTLAWRNIWRHPRRTWLTVSAMVFSNCLLVFMNCLQAGMYQLMIDSTLDIFTGHIQLQAPGYLDEPDIRKSIPRIQSQAARVREELEGVAVSARASGFALASSDERSYGIQLIGVQPESEALVSTLPGLINQGRYLQVSDQKTVVIGSVLARNLKVGLGDELVILGSGRDGSMAADVLTIVGILESNMPDIDRNMAFITLDYFQDVFFMQDSGHSIVIHVEDFSLIATKAAQLNRYFAQNDDLVVLDWETLEEGLRQAIEADLVSAWFIYAVLIVLVAFSVMNTQLMSVLERTREFGIVMALGVRATHMVRQVLLEAGLLATLGLLLGVSLGALLVLIISQTGLAFPGMEEVMGRFNLPDRLYPELTLFALFLGPAIVFMSSMLAALYPALRLYLLQPIEAMKVA